MLSAGKPWMDEDAHSSSAVGAVKRKGVLTLCMTSVAISKAFRTQLRNVR